MIFFHFWRIVNFRFTSAFALSWLGFYGSCMCIFRNTYCNLLEIIVRLLEEQDRREGEKRRVYPGLAHSGGSDQKRAHDGRKTCFFTFQKSNFQKLLPSLRSGLFSFLFVHRNFWKKSFNFQSFKVKEWTSHLNKKKN